MGNQSKPTEGLSWRVSSFCYNGNCVEVAFVADTVAVRDSKDPNGYILRYDEPAWRDFLKGIQAGEFDI